MRRIGDDLRMKTMIAFLSAYRDLFSRDVSDNMAIYATATKASSSRSWVLCAELSMLSDMAEGWRLEIFL